MFRQKEAAKKAARDAEYDAIMAGVDAAAEEVEEAREAEYAAIRAGADAAAEKAIKQAVVDEIAEEKIAAAKTAATKAAAIKLVLGFIALPLSPVIALGYFAKQIYTIIFHNEKGKTLYSLLDILDKDEDKASEMTKKANPTNMFPALMTLSRVFGITMTILCVLCLIGSLAIPIPGITPLLTLGAVSTAKAFGMVGITMGWAALGRMAGSLLGGLIDCGIYAYKGVFKVLSSAATDSKRLLGLAFLLAPLKLGFFGDLGLMLFKKEKKVAVQNRIGSSESRSRIVGGDVRHIATGLAIDPSAIAPTPTISNVLAQASTPIVALDPRAASALRRSTYGTPRMGGYG